MTLRPSLWITFFVLGMGTAGTTFAQEPQPPEVDAIQAVISSQWTAFADNDAPKALSFAVPEIRQRFEDPEGFLLMVELRYPVVFHHVAYRFLAPRVGTYFSFQWVRMTDDQGSVWRVLYQLHREMIDGPWLIGGVFEYPEENAPNFLPDPQGA